MNPATVTEPIPTSRPAAHQTETPPEAIRRLVYFVLGLLLAVVALECFVRANSSLFAAASHRALTKVAIFEKHPRVDFLFLGTSRTQDGVSPVLMTRALREISPELGDVPGYNAAFTGSSLDSLIELVPHFGFRRDLKLVIIEVSSPQILNEPAPWKESEIPPVSVEDKLRNAAGNFHFIRYRKAFLSDNLGRLPALLIFPRSLSGWETKGKDQVASWLGREEQSANGFDAKIWTPELCTTASPAQKLDAINDAVANQLVAVARQFQEHGIKVAFAVPPMTRALDAPEKKSMKPLLVEIARRSECEVWNFAPLTLPDHFFRDPSHLGTVGRAHYSKALALQAAHLLKGKPE